VSDDSLDGHKYGEQLSFPLQFFLIGHFWLFAFPRQLAPRFFQSVTTLSETAFPCHEETDWLNCGTTLQ